MIILDHLDIQLMEFHLQDITLSVAEGEFFILLGPTGAGKTVLLEAIAGLIPVTKGAIYIRGADVTDMPPEQRHIGIVYQDYALFPHLTVYENIVYGQRYHPGDATESTAWVQWLAEELGIEHLMRRSILNLSGGEKQRVALARALAVHPSVLLLDEPLSALDPNFRESLRNLLKKLHRDLNMTFLMVTHDFAEALFLGERTAILNAGRIEQIDTVNTVFQQPATPFVAEFVGMKNVFPATFQDRTARVGDMNLQLAASPPTHHRYIGIRPEDILIKPAPNTANGHNLLEGQVLDISHRGVYHEVKLQAGPILFTALLTRRALFETHLSDNTPIQFAVKPALIHTF